MERYEGKPEVQDSRAFLVKQGVGAGPTCFYCKKSGHIKRHCPKLKEKEREANEEKEKRKREKDAANIAGTSGRGSQTQDHDSSDSDCGFISITITDHALSSGAQIEKDDWLIDSGANKNMGNDKESFTELRPLEKDDPKKVAVGDGNLLDVKMKGTVELDVEVDGEIKKCKLKNTLFVPDLCFNLVSVGKASESEVTVIFSGDDCKFINKHSTVIATGQKVHGLYQLNCIKSKAKALCVTSKVNDKESVWHSRFAHLGNKNLSKLSKEEMVLGFDYDIPKSQEICKPCAEGKHHRSKFPKEGGKRAKEILEIVHSDVWGKMDVQSLSKKEHFGTFIDDKSRFTWTYALRYKSDMLDTFIEWKAMVERSTEKKVKTLRSDNGGEYISTEFENYLKQEGILHQNTIPKTPEQNGVAERMNRSLQEAMRSMLCESGLPKRFWAEALNTATYIRNRSPTRSVLNMTPHEAFTGEKPTVSHLKVFGCLTYAHIPKDERKKLDPKAREAIFLGYGTNVKGYRLYDVNRQKVFYSRDVLFEETKFYKQYRNKSNSDDVESNESYDKQEASEMQDMNKNKKFQVRESYNPEEISLQNQDNISTFEENSETQEEEREIKMTTDQVNFELPVETSEDNTQLEPSHNEVSQRRSIRTRKPPNRLGEWVFCAQDKNILKDPTNAKEALSSENNEEWHKAMKSEIESLQKNNVWELEELPEGRSAIGCIWVFKTKLNAQGNIERYEARLVAQGFTQRYGVDYDETFSPVVRFESVFSPFAIASKYKLTVHQMDVRTAFLNGELKEKKDGFVS